MRIKERGRPRKIKTDELIQIICNYHNENPEIILKPMKLVKYAQDTHLNINYQDFSRNKHASELINVINENIKWELFKKANINLVRTIPSAELNSRVDELLKENSLTDEVKDIITLINNEKELAFKRSIELERKLSEQISKNIKLTKSIE